MFQTNLYGKYTLVFPISLSTNTYAFITEKKFRTEVLTKMNLKNALAHMPFCCSAIDVWFFSVCLSPKSRFSRSFFPLWCIRLIKELHHCLGLHDISYNHLIKNYVEPFNNVNLKCISKRLKDNKASYSWIVLKLFSAMKFYFNHIWVRWESRNQEAYCWACGFVWSTSITKSISLIFIWLL